MSIPNMEHEERKAGGASASLPLRTEGFGVEMRGVYLRRLQRLLDLRKNHEGQLNFEGMRLIDKSIYATYCDCVSVGALEAAQEVLRRSTVALPAVCAGIRLLVAALAGLPRVYLPLVRHFPETSIQAAIPRLPCAYTSAYSPAPADNHHANDERNSGLDGR